MIGRNIKNLVGGTANIVRRAQTAGESPQNFSIASTLRNRLKMKEGGEVKSGTSSKPNKLTGKSDKPIVDSVRSGGKMTPRFARDMDMDEPIPARGMKDSGRGLETIPDKGMACGGKVKKYAAGGSVKGYGKAKGGKKCKMY